MSAAERLYRIARLIRDTPLTVQQLVQHLAPGLVPTSDVGLALERNVQRDLKLLGLLDTDYSAVEGRPRKHLLRVQQKQLHPVEALALHAATRLVYHRSPGHSRHHQRALAQLAQWLPERVRPVVERSVADVGRRRSREDLMLEVAAEAWTGGHSLRFEYRSASGSGQWRMNELEIYLIEVHPVNLDLYAVGREVSFHQKLRTFKLARMRGAKVLQERSYTIPDDFDPRSFFHDAWGVVGSGNDEGLSVTLRFAPEVAYRILEGGYPNMSEPLFHLDSSIEVDIRAGVDNSGLPRELMPWILGWGPRVEVLGPPHVRAHWIQQAREVVQKFGTPADSAATKTSDVPALQVNVQEAST